MLRMRCATIHDSDKIKEFIASVLAEYGLGYCPLTTDSDLADIENVYIGSGGMFEVMENQSGQIVGTVGLVPLDSARCELRKMYLHRSVRGRGLGKQLLDLAIARATHLGFTSIELETASVLKEAIGLYTSRGFVPAEKDHLSNRCDQSYRLDLS